MRHDGVHRSRRSSNRNSKNNADRQSPKEDGEEDQLEMRTTLLLLWRKGESINQSLTNQLRLDLIILDFFDHRSCGEKKMVQLLPVQSDQREDCNQGNVRIRIDRCGESNT